MPDRQEAISPAKMPPKAVPSLEFASLRCAFRIALQAEA
jgi:hypothetical protein